MTRLPLLACLAALICGAAHAQPIRIGELNSYKTFPAFLEPYKKGWQLALEEVNAAGGVSWQSDAPAFAVNGLPAYQDAAWLRDRRAEGLDIQGIADRAGISYHTIRKYLKKYGLQLSAKEKAKLSGLVQRGSRRTFAKPRTAVRAARSGKSGRYA